MKYCDCHMHMMKNMVRLEDFLKQLDEAGVEAVSAFSFPPESYGRKQEPGCPLSAKDRIALLKDWMNRSERIYGMFWIDPIAPDALEQADMALEAGVSGFKVICDRFYPDDPRAMKTYAYIAEAGKPVLFHSGVLYGPHASSKYNLPLNFEPLIEIPKLRFALAHLSWPWVDEFLAVFGHWRDMSRRGLVSSELFCDTTPGTPDIYREDAFYKIFNIGYHMEDAIMIGSDNLWDYRPDRFRSIAEKDSAIFDKLGRTQEDKEKYFCRNFLRFIGKEKE